MPQKTYKTPEKTPLTVSEPAVDYGTAIPKISSYNGWNPNVPFHGTQEEWWEHFHRIEEGNFMTLEEFDHKFETWKKKYLARKL
jgi:hypothetical protein